MPNKVSEVAPACQRSAVSPIRIPAGPDTEVRLELAGSKVRIGLWRRTGDGSYTSTLAGFLMAKRVEKAERWHEPTEPE